MMFSIPSKTFLANACAVGSKFDPLTLKGNSSDAAYQKFIKIIHQNENTNPANPFHLFIICSLDNNVTLIYISFPNPKNLTALAYPISTPIRVVINQTRSLKHELSAFWLNDQAVNLSALKSDASNLLIKKTCAAYLASDTLINAPDFEPILGTDSVTANAKSTEKPVEPISKIPDLERANSIALLDMDEIPFQGFFDLQEENKSIAQDAKPYKMDGAQHASSRSSSIGNRNNRLTKWHPIVSFNPSTQDDLPGVEQTQEPAIMNDMHLKGLDSPSSTTRPKQHKSSLETVSFILVPRDRSHYLLGSLSHNLRNWIPDICKNMGWRLINLSIRPDYLRWALQDFPDYAIPGMLKIFREETSTYIFANYPSLKKDGCSADFWSEGYIVDRKNHNFSTQSLNLLLPRKKF